MKSRVGPTRREVIGSAGAGLVFRTRDGGNVLPKITSVTIAGSSSAATFSANTGNADVGAIVAATSDSSTPNITITGNSEGFSPRRGQSGMHLFAPARGLSAGNYTGVTIVASGSYSNSPQSINPTLTAATARLFINGLKSGIAPIPGGDEFWVRVVGGVGAPHDRLWVKDATHNTVQTFWDGIPAGTSDWVLRATYDLGTALPPGAYTLMLASPYPSVAAVLSFTVSASISSLFQPYDPTNGSITYTVTASPLVAGSSGSANVVSGRVTFSGAWLSNGLPGPTDITMQWVLSGNGTDTLIGGQTHFSNGLPTLTLDTGAFPDGSYILHGRVVDSGDTGPNRLAPQQCFIYPVQVIIINNPSAPAHDPTLTHTIPSAYFYGNFRAIAPSEVDYVTYQGLPELNSLHPFPDTAVIRPSNSATLRDPSNWYIGTIGACPTEEYQTASMFWTSTLTPRGGIFVGPWVPKNAGGAAVEGSDLVNMRTSYLDGGYHQNMMPGFTIFAATPHRGPFSAHWSGVQLDGRLFTYDKDGTLTTIAGYKRDLSKLPTYWFNDANPVHPNTVLVGTIDTNPLYTIADFTELHDLCWDPRDPYICYVARPLRHDICKVNFHTQTLNGLDYSLTNPLIQRFAGYENGINHDGVWDYADGPALASGTNGAQFGGVYSICMQKRTDIPGHPQGTMYVADNYNGLVRKISAETLDPSTGNQAVVSTVTTLLGLHDGTVPPCAGPWPNFASFYQNRLSIVETYSLNAIKSNGDSTASISVNASSTIVASVGWKVTVLVNGGRYTGGGSTDENAYGIYTVSSFTSSTNFSVTMNSVPSSGTLTMDVNALDTYSSPTQISFPAAYTAYPAFVRMSSGGDIILGEQYYNHMLRRIWLSGPNQNTITRIGPFGNLAINGGLSWGMQEIDYYGTCGPQDDIVFFKVTSNPGSAAIIWRVSIDGSYSKRFAGDASVAFPMQSTGGGGHYPWAFVFSETEGRALSLGLVGACPYAWHVRQGSEPSAATDYYLTTIVPVSGAFSTQTTNPFTRGTHPQLPSGLRPSFCALWGNNGVHWYGANVLPTIDDLWTLKPNDYAPYTGSLAEWVHNGAGGTVVRPEFAMDDETPPPNAPYSAPVMGRPLAALVYFFRRQSLAGSGLGGTLYQAPRYSLDFIRPNVTVQAGDPTRINSTSIRVRWATDKNTIGLVAAGTPNSHSKQWKYSMWSPLETTYGRAHDITLSGILAVSPTYVVVVAIDKAGNWGRSPEFTVP